VKRTVVLVDDLAELRQILRLILEHGGPFRVVGEGASGEEAVALAAELHPDLLLMDVEMPGGPSGWAVLPRIREVAPETAVVILSGSRADAAAPVPGLAAKVLEKGMPPKELNAALVELLGIEPPAEPPSPSPSPASPATAAPAAAAPAPPRATSTAAGLEGFASVAGHDLAQPLQVAYGYLEMLRADYGPALDANAAGWLDAAVGSLERMRVLVQDILAFARAGTSPLHLAPVDLAGALARAAADLPGVDLRHGELPTVTADRDQLVEVLHRLLQNAATFAAGDDGRVAVEVTAEEAPEDWTITVADDGPGVPSALHDRVFEPFQRGSSAAGRGPGVGLAIATKLVEAHGGRLWLDPEPPGASGGARFRFSLPRRSPASASE
jgi:signal transduction histidine kinase